MIFWGRIPACALLVGVATLRASLTLGASHAAFGRPYGRLAHEWHIFWTFKTMQKASHTSPTVQDYYRMIRDLSLDDRLALLSMLSAGIVTELQSEWLDHLWSDEPDDFSPHTEGSPTHVVTLDTLFKKEKP